MVFLLGTSGISLSYTYEEFTAGTFPELSTLEAKRALSRQAGFFAA